MKEYRQLLLSADCVAVTRVSQGHRGRCECVMRVTVRVTESASQACYRQREREFVREGREFFTLECKKE